DANLLKAVDIAERVMPYRHHRLAAIKLDKDLTPRNEQKSLEQLRAEMQKRWERLAPVLELEVLVAPSDGIANREVTLKRRSRTLLDTPPDGTMMCSNPEQGAPSWTSWSGCGAWASGSMRRSSARTRLTRQFFRA